MTGMGDGAEGTVHWLKNAGVKFRDVWFYRNHTFSYEPQVDDPDTFDIVVQGLVDRRNGYAIYFDQGEWVAHHKRKGIRRYPTRGAAEMIAVHNA